MIPISDSSCEDRPVSSTSLSPSPSFFREEVDHTISTLRDLWILGEDRLLKRRLGEFVLSLKEMRTSLDLYGRVSPISSEDRARLEQKLNKVRTLAGLIPKVAGDGINGGVETKQIEERSCVIKTTGVSPEELKIAKHLARVPMTSPAFEHLPRVFQARATGIAMEYIPHKVRPTRPLDFRLAIQATYAICRALDEIKKITGEEWIHGDLKFPNLLERDDGSLVLVDWGMSHVMGEKVEKYGGTYFAPETGDDKYHLPTKDAWALGSMIYKSLTGLEEPVYDNACLGKRPYLDWLPGYIHNYRNPAHRFGFDKAEHVQAIKTYNERCQAFRAKIEAWTLKLSEKADTPEKELIVKIMQRFLEIDPAKRLLPQDALKLLTRES